MDDLELVGPNGGAYEKAELRMGPPLVYVGEKMRSCIEEVQREVRSGRKELRAALMYGVTAFLALYNMLALASSPDLLGRIEAFTPDELSDWFDGIEREGLVQG